MRINKNSQRIFALFVTMLFILIPVYISDVMAAEIVSLDAYGSAGISGVRAAVDTTTLEAHILAPGESALHNVIIKENPIYKLKCVLESNTTGMFTCTYVYPETPTSTPFSATIQVFNAANQPLSTPKSVRVFVDALAPRITDGSFQIVPDEAGGLIGEFYVKDIACDAAECDGKCAGIKKVEFKSGTSILGTYSNSTSDCLVSGKVPLSLTFSGTQEYSICLVATDNVDQSSDPSCKVVTVDRTTPTLQGAVRIKDSQGNLLTATKGEPIGLGVLEFNISEDVGIDESKISLIGFDPRPEQAGATIDYQASCTQWAGADNWVCQAFISGSVLAITEPKTLQVKIYVKDTSGNVLNTTVDYPIDFDTTSPALTSITSEFIDPYGEYWINGSGFDLKATFVESGSGMSQMKAALDLTAFGTQTVVEGSESALILRPNECIEAGSGWDCFWRKLQANAVPGSNLMVIMTRAEDDAGNSMNKTGYGRFKLDNRLPHVLNVTVIPIGETENLGVIGEGDILLIRAFVQDHTPLIGAANLTRIIEQGTFNFTDNIGIPFSNIDGVCEEFNPGTEEELAIYAGFSASLDPSQRLYQCIWETEPVLQGYHNHVSYWLTFTDLLGHVNVHQELITIYKRLNETEMRDFWKLTVDEPGITAGGQRVNTLLHPSTGLDRFVWGLGSQTVFQEFKLTPSTGSPRILDLEFGAERCFTGLEYVAHDPETGLFAIDILGYDVRPDRRHDAIMIMTEPSAIPEVQVETEQEVPGYYGEGEESQTITIAEPVLAINLSCQMGITSLVQYDGIEAITVMEAKNFTISIPVYNNPLGQNLDNVQKKVVDLAEHIDKYWGRWISVMRSIFEYMNAICGLFGSLFGLWQTFNEVKEFFAVTSESLQGPGEIIKEPLDATEGGVGKVGLGIDAIMDGEWMGQLYSILCGLLVQCRVTQGDVDQYTCKDDVWCSVRKGWIKWNQAWLKIMDATWIGTGGRWTRTPTGTTESGKDLYDAPFDPSGPGQSVPKGTEVEQHLFTQASFDPKQSIISSVFSACLPGIIYNLDKYRQILCKKLICYKSEVPYGTPIFICDKTAAYDTCVHWIGQIFMAIPLFQYLQEISRLLQGLLENPYQFIGMAVDHICNAAYSGKVPPGMLTACNILRWGTQVANAIMGIVSTFKNWDQLGNDICEEAMKDLPDVKKLGVKKVHK